MATRRCWARAWSWVLEELCWRKVKPWMIHGARTQERPEATTRTMSAAVVTVEMERHARLSPSRARRSTTTGMKVALSTPPMTRSKSMLGMVLARLKASARGVNPRTQARTRTRNSPVARDTAVPPAMDTTRRPCDTPRLIVRVAPGTCDERCAATTRPARRARRRSRDSPRWRLPPPEPESPRGPVRSCRRGW